MKYLIILLLGLNYSGYGEIPIAQVRQICVEVMHGKQNADSLLKLVSNSNIPLFQGYAGAAYMLKAKELINPLKKWNYFQKGRQILDSAINIDSRNIELRYLRYCFQCYSPGFLGYSQFMEEDRIYLENKQLALMDEDLELLIQQVLNACLCKK